MAEPIVAFDSSRLLMNAYPYSFLLEVATRAVATFIVSFIFLRIIGRRGVKQMTSFEVIILLTLGSAAGDVAFSPDVPLLPVLVTFVVVFCLYYLFCIFSQHSFIRTILAGKPKTVVENGALVWSVIKGQHVMYQELLMELREKSVDHFGQIRLAILETDGNVSIYFFTDKDVKPGLSVLPNDFIQSSVSIQSDGIYSCTQCSHTCYLTVCERIPCGVCGNIYWARSRKDLRIT